MLQFWENVNCEYIGLGPGSKNANPVITVQFFIGSTPAEMPSPAYIQRRTARQ